MTDDTLALDNRRREARLRRFAAELGLVLRKSRARDPNRMDFGRYRVEDPERCCVVAGRFPYGYTLDLDAVEEVLEEIRFDRAEKTYLAQSMPQHSQRS